MKRLTCAALAVCLALPLAPLVAWAQPASGPVVAVVHVDIAPPIPPGAAPDTANRMRSDADALGKQLVLELASLCRADLGCRRIQALQQLGSLNHFTLVETFDSAQAQANFESLPAVRAAREHIQPVLGGPLDQRYSSPIN